MQIINQMIFPTILTYYYNHNLNDLLFPSYSTLNTKDNSIYVLCNTLFENRYELGDYN